MYSTKCTVIELANLRFILQEIFKFMSAAHPSPVRFLNHSNISQLGNLTKPSPTEYHNRIMMSRLLIHGKEYSHYFHAFIFVFVSFFSQDKYERHTHCTDYDVVPGPEHDPSTWSPLTQLTDELNVTQCIDPQRFLICVFINQEKHALTYKGLYYQKTHSMSSL